MWCTFERLAVYIAQWTSLGAQWNRQRFKFNHGIYSLRHKHLAMQMYTSIKIKSEKYDTERGKIDIPNTQIQDRLFSWLVADTSMKSGGVKLVLWA